MSLSKPSAPASTGPFRASFRESFAATVLRAVSLVELVVTVRRERRELAALDDRMLKDIGLSRSLAALESERELHDLPKDRLRRHGL